MRVPVAAGRGGGRGWSGRDPRRFAAVLAFAAACLPHAARAQPPPTAPPDPAGPYLPMADPVHLPALAFRAGEDACDGEVEVQNLGTEPAKALLTVWGTTTACAPRCAGPVGVGCSGLIAPGGMWRFGRDDLPSGSASGAVYSLSTRPLTAIGLAGGRGLVADRICRGLNANVLYRCDGYLSLKRAYETGGAYQGIPMARAYGPPLAVEVFRSCAGDVSKLHTALASYAGIGGRDFGGRDHVFDISSYHVTLVNHGRDGFETALAVQNGGPNCASVELWVQERGVCRPSRPCKVFNLAQGASQTVDLAECVADGWEGAAWLNSSEPLAVAVDVFGHDTLMTYAAAPAELRYSWDGPPEFTAGSPAVVGPLIFGRDRGWDTRIHVQNLSSVTPAWVRATFLDPDGAPIDATPPEWVCPFGSRTFRVAAVDRRPGPWVGSVRVESLPWPTPASTPMPPAPGAPPPTATPARANITAVAELMRRRGAGGGGLAVGEVESALAYNLLAAPPAPERRTGLGEPQGAALVAVPHLVATGDAGVASRLAVANHVREPGATHAAVLLFDVNGLVDVTCLRIASGAVAYLDLGGWGHAGPAFVGSAVVSATAWDHAALDAHGRTIANRVGLAAVAVQQVGGDAGAAVGGDAFGATAGVPFRRESPATGSAAAWLGSTDCRPAARPTRGPGTEGPWRAWLPWAGG